MAAGAVGSQTKLAKSLGCTPQNVQRMCATGHVPAKHVLRIEEASGVSRSLLRPDLYPEAPPTLEQMMLQKSSSDQSADGAVNPSSAARVSP
ncbi:MULTISPECIES: transcriptional regulator [Pseudomonas chlororaphis group]|nr:MULTISPECIES: YdaS family helix-turn-helix protein [Pseudomonas chlororaphis group]MCO7575320.1 helix-turn-helix domain-containing protein [Pseudomonas protegens]MCO7582577.1 helix-turn-helix domain-containing protein [Pseudomonas chlororaphis]MCO7599244.1 helix-turn-helix domain-containing protein [Pseudomonas chlororaphis]